MQKIFLLLFVKLQDLLNRNEGQDVIEYSLLGAVIALTCITGVSHVATAVTTVFTNISSSLA